MPEFAPDGTMPSLRSVLASSSTVRLPTAEIRAEIDRQIDAFVAHAGRDPDFVDGHQHVHVLPGIRGPLLDALSRRSLCGRIWLRDPSDRIAAIASRRVCAGKGLFVGALATGFRRQARRAGFATNAGFSGFSGFNPARDPEAEMGRNLIALGKRPLVMCHPGLPDPAPDDIGEARRREHAYLASPAFGSLLGSAHIALAPAPA